MPLQTLATTLAAAERGKLCGRRVQRIRPQPGRCGARRGPCRKIARHRPGHRGDKRVRRRKLVVAHARTVVESYTDVTATLHLDHGRTD